MDTVFLVIINEDKNSSYCGLRDIHTEAFFDEGIAIDYLRTQFDKYVNEFKDENGEINVVLSEFNVTSFMVHNDNDYYSGEIRNLSIQGI